MDKIIFKKILKVEEAIKFSEKEYHSLVNPVVNEHVVNGALEVFEAIKLTDRQKDILSNPYISRLIGKNHISIHDAINITDDGLNIISRPCIYGFINLGLLSVNEAVKLSLKNINLISHPAYFRYCRDWDVKVYDLINLTQEKLNAIKEPHFVILLILNRIIPEQLFKINKLILEGVLKISEVSAFRVPMIKAFAHESVFSLIYEKRILDIKGDILKLSMNELQYLSSLSEFDENIYQLLWCKAININEALKLNKLVVGKLISSEELNNFEVSRVKTIVHPAIFPLIYDKRVLGVKDTINLSENDIENLNKNVDQLLWCKAINIHEALKLNILFITKLLSRNDLARLDARQIKLIARTNMYSMFFDKSVDIKRVVDFFSGKLTYSKINYNDLVNLSFNNSANESDKKDNGNDDWKVFCKTANKLKSCCSKEMSVFIDEIIEGRKETYSQAFERLEIEEDDSMCCPISFCIPNIPVYLDGSLFDFCSFFDASGNRSVYQNPRTRSGFNIKLNVTPAKNIKRQIEYLISRESIYKYFEKGGEYKTDKISFFYRENNSIDAKYSSNILDESSTTTVKEEIGFDGCDRLVDYLKNNKTRHAKQLLNFINGISSGAEETYQQSFKRLGIESYDYICCKLGNCVPNIPVYYKGELYDLLSLYDDNILKNEHSFDDIIIEITPGRNSKNTIENIITTNQKEIYDSCCNGESASSTCSP